jgi:hypothetical protein
LQAFQTKEKHQILSLVEMQKLRAKRMKQMRRGAAKLKEKTDAAVKIQRWFRRLMTNRVIVLMQRGFVQAPETSSTQNTPGRQDITVPNEYMINSQMTGQPVEQVSSTQRVQNLIKQKLE